VAKPAPARFHDIRDGFHEAHYPNDYRVAQVLARELREAGSNGIVYRSVRHKGGSCLAALRLNGPPDNRGCPSRSERKIDYVLTTRVLWEPRARVWRSVA
jgi:hypothetical protein